MSILTPELYPFFNDALTKRVALMSADFPPDDDSGHSRISPSKLKQTILCPGSLQMGEDSRIPPEAPNHAAERGTALHDVMSQALSALFLNPDAINWQDLYDRFDEYEGEAGGSLALTRALRAVQALMSDEDVRPFGFCEQRVCVSQQWDIYGTVDLWWIDRQLRLHILDFKFGKTPVEVEENSQLKAYALGVCSMLPPVLDVPCVNPAGEEVDDQVNLLSEGFKVILHIVQPEVLGDTAATWTTNIYDLVSWWGGEVVYALNDATGVFGRALLKASPDACHWCKASAICAARRGMTEQQAAHVFSKLAETQARTLTDDEVFELYHNTQSMEQAIKTVKGYVMATLAKGPKCGLKLVRARGRRGWLNGDDQKLWDYLGELEGEIDNFEYMKSTLLTPPALLKAYPKLKKDKTLADFIHMAPGKSISVVAETDPREAVTDVNPFEGYEDNEDEVLE